METEKSKPKLIRKQTVANEILIFFKISKFTAPIAIVLFILLYTMIYKIPYSKHPDLKGVYVEPTQYGTREHYGNDQNAIVWRWYERVYRAPYGLRLDLMQDAHLEWVDNKTKLILILSLVEFLGLPILFILIRSILRSYFKIEKWVEENKTI
jgi:hypothetical protein